MQPAELKSVKIAIGEHMLIECVATVSLTVGEQSHAVRSVRHEIHGTPDLTEFILGGDWMAKQGRLT